MNEWKALFPLCFRFILTIGADFVDRVRLEMAESAWEWASEPWSARRRPKWPFLRRADRHLAIENVVRMRTSSGGPLAEEDGIVALLSSTAPNLWPLMMFFCSVLNPRK